MNDNNSGEGDKSNDNAPLDERKFIQENYKKDPLSIWIWLALLAGLMAFLWGIGSWYTQFLTQKAQENPFLQVTNRQLSLFLWQFPQYMRSNVKDKSGYLPGFVYSDHVGLDIAQADHYAIAPPSLLFIYHTWSRLLKKEFTSRRIPLNEFKDFLDASPEWLPQNWPQAPKEYAELVKGLSDLKTKDLSLLSQESVPDAIRMAFQGWKNYFVEGAAINKLNPTYGQLREFLDSHPHYARNYWRNILLERYPKYLLSLSDEEKKSDDTIPSDQIAPFLKVALFNWLQAKAGT